MITGSGSTRSNYDITIVQPTTKIRTCLAFASFTMGHLIKFDNGEVILIAYLTACVQYQCLRLRLRLRLRRCLCLSMVVYTYVYDTVYVDVMT